MLLTEEKINELKSLISSFDIKEVKQGRTFRVVASTEDSDRSWEIIKAAWWDYSNFMKNPVIIANHVYKIENIVGKATDIYVKDNQLIIEWPVLQPELCAGCALPGGLTHAGTPKSWTERQPC